MADPKRLVLQKALCAHLESTVRVANGYHFDLAGRVSRGRTTFGDEEPLPQVSVLDALNPDRDVKPNNHTNSVQTEKYVLLVHGWAEDDRENPTDPAHRLMGDVKKAIGQLMDPRAPATYLLPVPGAPQGLVLATQVEPGTVRPPDQVSCRAYFYVRVIFTLKESIADPYKLN